MPSIRPVSDLRNKFAEISRIVHERQEPVFLTKIGNGNMVVMSMEEYERLSFEHEIHLKLLEAEIQAKQDDTRYSHDEVFAELRGNLGQK